MPNVKSVRSPKAPRAKIRAQIDTIDNQILDLLASRLKLAREVGAAKRAAARQAGKKKPAVFVPEREEDILRRLHRLSDQLNMPWPLVQAVFTDIISLGRAVQGQITAHVLGPVGTHSEWAARARFGSAVALKHHSSIPAAVKAAEQAAASGELGAVAVVPLENSHEGTVTAAVDTLVATSLKLVGEGYYRVRHALLARGGRLEDVKTIYSHPMGLAQCSRWIQENLPAAKLVEVSSTSEAAKQAAASGRGSAAVASPYLASERLTALVGDIQDSAENTTRFGILGPSVPGPSGDDKTSLVFSLPNKAGSLMEAVNIFSRARINMTKIESRPHRGLQWEYLFYVDLDGHAFDPKITKALESFGEKVRYFKILGTYPKGRAWN